MFLSDASIYRRLVPVHEEPSGDVLDKVKVVGGEDCSPPELLPDDCENGDDVLRVVLVQAPSGSVR